MSAALKTVELPAEAAAFIKEGTPKPRVGIQTEPAANPKDDLDEARPAASAMVGLSFRLPADIHEALLRVAFERKLRRERPWTQQEIAAEVLAEWLEKHGNAAPSRSKRRA